MPSSTYFCSGESTLSRSARAWADFASRSARTWARSARSCRRVCTSTASFLSSVLAIGVRSASRAARIGLPSRLLFGLDCQHTGNRIPACRANCRIDLTGRLIEARAVRSRTIRSNRALSLWNAAPGQLPLCQGRPSPPYRRRGRPGQPAKK